MKYFKGEYYLEDCNSKFGTLVQINEPLNLAENQPYCIQAGRTVLTLLSKNPMKQLHSNPQQTEAEIEKHDITNKDSIIMHAQQQECIIENAFNNAHPSFYYNQL